MCPQTRHSRRCTQRVPSRTQSSQPSTASGVAANAAVVCSHVAVVALPYSSADTAQVWLTGPNVPRWPRPLRQSIKDHPPCPFRGARRVVLDRPGEALTDTLSQSYRSLTLIGRLTNSLGG